ncbi:MAG TPA: GntR family transcriptional regulator, partial [Crenalkalicoccus sp.]|nr:GntR family transcriptional regulator [Crenalkalicoccus sp.]
MPDDLAPARRPEDATRSLSVTARLRDGILAGDHAPGEHMHEVRLAERLGVSRTPVRAALQALAAEGLLDYTPNRGYVVRAVPLSEALD